MDNRSNYSKRAAFLLIAGCGLFSVAGPVRAEISMAQREACTPDALRLCSAEIPDVGKVKACMLENKANLSARCRAAFPSEQTASPRVAKGSIHVASATRHVASVNRVDAHDGSRTDVHRTAARRNRGRHEGMHAFGVNELTGMLGRQQISPDEAMGIARQILTTYRAACGSRAIPADYCSY